MKFKIGEYVRSTHGIAKVKEVSVRGYIGLQLIKKIQTGKMMPNLTEGQIYYWYTDKTRKLTPLEKVKLL